MPPRFSIDALLSIGGTLTCVAGLIWYMNSTSTSEKRSDALQAELSALRSGSVVPAFQHDITPIEHLVPAPFNHGTTERDAALLAMASDPEQVAKGDTAFLLFCIACHGPGVTTEANERSELFDQIWYHGASPAQIELTSRNGYVPTGMVGWDGLVPDDQLTAAVVYLIAKQLELEEAP